MTYYGKILIVFCFFSFFGERENRHCLIFLMNGKIVIVLSFILVNGKIVIVFHFLLNGKNRHGFFPFLELFPSLRYRYRFLFRP
jgi:hypothetical protein